MYGANHHAGRSSIPTSSSLNSAHSSAQPGAWEHHQGSLHCCCVEAARPVLRRVCFKSLFLAFSFFYHRGRRVGHHSEERFYKWCPKKYQKLLKHLLWIVFIFLWGIFCLTFLVLSAFCKNWNSVPKCDSIPQTPHPGCINLQRKTYLMYLRHLFLVGINIPLEVPLFSQ